MAEILSADAIDFSKYYRETEASAKVRPASVFADELRREFAEKPKGRGDGAMHSTKLGRRIEFRPGEVTAWAGYNGHRKSMFTGQVALDLCAQDRRVMLASFEMQPSRSLARMARQWCGAHRPADSRLDEFSEWTDSRLWLFDHIGRISPAQVMAVCKFFADERKGDQVVIDSMMMVCASEESLDEQKQFMTDLVRLAQETGLHVHLVTHCRKPQSGDESKPPTKYDLRGSAAISDQAHNVITVWANQEKREVMEQGMSHAKYHEVKDHPDAVVAICKQRNGSFEGKTKLWFHSPSMRFTDEQCESVAPYGWTLQDARTPAHFGGQA